MFILDCSVMMAACLSDEDSPYADSVIDSMNHQTALVPALWAYEVGNTLLIAERRKRIGPTQRLQYLASIESLPIQICPPPSVSRLNNLVSLAQSLGLSLYDMSYLDLAMGEKLTLASLDSKLVEAAKQCGVSRYLS